MENIWEEFLQIVRQNAGSRVVETWFKAIMFRRWDPYEKVVYLQAPNRFVRDWIRSNYMTTIETNLSRLLNVQPIRIILEAAGDRVETLELKKDTTPVVSSIKPAQKSTTKKVLATTTHDCVNKHYTFDNFVVGPSNSLAYAAAKAVSEKPGILYNPLFLYGGSGLGKTHLLHAIGNGVRKLFPDLNIVYQTADRFVHEFINAIRFDKVNKFKSKYRSVDVLLIDDIQFISNKEQTQEAFFHIFNALYDARKQIIFSSDNVPQDIRGLADRLRSRLAWGLVADLKVPSTETRVAILKRKAESSNHLLDNAVAHFIAGQTVSNIRELEGLLIRVMAFASLTRQEVTLELAQRVLHQTHVKKNMHITFDSVITCIQKRYQYTLQDLRSKNRNKELVLVRQITMYLMKKSTGKSLRDIGIFLGGRDHSTVMHALSKIRSKAGHDEAFKFLLESIHKDIESTTP